MFSIQQWFAKDDEFLALLKESADAGRSSIQALKAILKNPTDQPSLEAFIDVRRKDKIITVRIAELLARTSITSLDPEDIEAISNALYKIPKTVEKFAERHSACGAMLREVDFSRQVALAEQCTDIVATMIQALEKSQFEEVNATNQKLQIIEGDADKLMLQLLQELYKSAHPTLTIIIVKDLYELLEKVVDRCRDVGNVVANVVLKHS
jgi:uncharacterized protein Yka (UPF0111/DUF47 family)